MHRRLKGSVMWAVFIVIVVTSGGCAGFLESLPDVQTNVLLPESDAPGSPPTALAPTPESLSSPAAENNDQAQPSITVADAPTLAAVASSPPEEPAVPEGQSKDAGQKGKEAQDENYDPFAKREEGEPEELEEYDPWEPFNTAIFEFNRKVDKYILKPVAQVYEKVMPDALELGIKNFFHNVRLGPRLINNILQGKVKGAGLEVGRFLVNSTLGVGGFFNPAKNLFGMETPDEDTGQTLGVYGVKPGPYLVLPLLPPLTLRDFFGFLMDLALDPINYLVFPVVEIDGVPSLIKHKNRETSTFGQLGSRVEEIVNERALNLETFQGVEEATVDLYGAVRNAYLQKRAKAIRE
ncbi:MAG: VacJ family lipoprotein [Nitrospirae bacterium]|nr:VacJ family lipoprotein [Nitrospirota bacterium]